MMNRKFTKPQSWPMLWPAFAIFTMMGLSACSGHSTSPTAQDQGTISEQENLQASGILTITDSSGQAIVGAKVLIGSALNTPFSGNLLTTDANGQVAAPALWTNNQPVTIDAPGFVRTTYMAQIPGALNLQVRSQIGTAQLLVTGQTTQFGNLQNDGTLDIGLVFPGFMRKDLINFQLNNMISPVNDQISVAGKTVAMPSNVTMPDQTETYIIFPVEFNKPQYRFFVGKTGTYSMIAEHAQLPFQKIVDSMSNGGSLLDSVNDIHFVSASVQDVPVGALGVSIDLPVNETNFDSSIAIKAPSIDASQIVLSVALAARNSLLYPSDMKRLTSGQSQTLTYPSTAKPGQGLVLSALVGSDVMSHKGADAEQMSLTFSATNQSQVMDFLTVINAPHVSTTSLTATVPARLASAAPLLTFASQSQVNGTQLTPHWDIFAPGWSGAIDFVNWPNDVAPTGPLRWEVTFAAGSPGTAALKLGPALLESATHLTRAAVDL